MDDVGIRRRHQIVVNARLAAKVAANRIGIHRPRGAGLAIPM
jgi:hypothetical protein